MSTYEDKIKKAISYILKNLDKELHWKTISKECGISEYHFHRIFCATIKETPREFIIRKRLERALSKLAYGQNINLSQLALDSGYSSQSNFTKAFKLYFGVTPKQIIEGINPTNSTIGKIKSKYGKDFEIEKLYPSPEVNNDCDKEKIIMDLEIKSIPEREVVYSTSKGGYKREAIFETWSSLKKKVSMHGNNMDELITFGIGHDNPQVTPELKCRYDACILSDSIQEIPKDLNRQKLPEGKYACLYFKGSNSELIQTYLNIYKNWFSDNGVEPGNFPLIERYIFVDKDNPEADIEVETQFLLK